MIHESSQFVLFAQFEHFDQKGRISVLVNDLDLVQIQVLDQTLVCKEREICDQQGVALGCLEQIVEDLGTGGQQESMYVQIHIISLLVKVLEFEGKIRVVGQDKLFRQVVGKGVGQVLDYTNVVNSS